jgi:GNAT superfamily N-acetyltransferase
MTGPRLRALAVDDWRVWRELRLAALAEAPHAFRAPLADWTEAGDTESRWRDRLETVGLNLVAELDGQPAGMVSGDWVSPGTVRLRSLWVAPTARGSGVGARLVAAVVEWAERAGAGRVVLGVFESNHDAVSLYLRHGFVRGGVAQLVPGDDRPELVMERPLASQRTPPGAPYNGA